MSRELGYENVKHAETSHINNVRDERAVFEVCMTKHILEKLNFAAITALEADLHSLLKCSEKIMTAIFYFVSH